MTVPLPTATLLVTTTHQDADEQVAFDALAETVSARLRQPVIPFAIDQPHRSLTQILSELLRYGIARIITLPVFLSPADHQRYAVEESVSRFNCRWPFIQHHVGPQFEWADWLQMLEASAVPDPVEGIDYPETAVILVSHSDGDPNINSDVAKLGRLFYEAHNFGWVDVAFVNGHAADAVTPTVTELIARYQTLGAGQIIVVPHMLFDGAAYQKVLCEVQCAREHCQLSVTNCFSYHSTLIDRLLARHQAALADRSLLRPTAKELEAHIAATQAAAQAESADVPANAANEFQRIKSKIDAILPPRYQGQTDEVSAAPMAAADLVFDEDGVVLWDQMFGVDDSDNPYCELALAGGPSHRGELLEAVDGAACLAEPGKYAAALDECGRGIQMITGMGIVESDAPGWIGVQCDSEEMAIWLMRAIIVENVMVRRQSDVLYLPVGPHYTLKDQIKSIVTVTAKTWHYWVEHITYQELFRAAQASVSENATPEAAEEVHYDHFRSGSPATQVTVTCTK